MAQIETRVERTMDLCLFTVQGQVTVPEVHTALEQFYAQGPTLNALWDFTETDAAALTADDLRAIVELARSKAPHRPGGRTALVVHGDFSFGMARMYEILAEVGEHPITHGVFRSRDEAFRWLTGTQEVTQDGDDT